MAKEAKGGWRMSFGGSGEKNKDKNAELYERTDPAKFYEQLELIGKGTYGCVYKGRSKQTNEIVALKVMDTEDLEEQDVKNELQILRRLDHPNICRFFGAFMRGKRLTMVLELCDGGSVLDIREGLNIPFSEPMLQYIIRETARGVQYLHSIDLIHRDIKGGNVLFTENGTVKLADFGVSVQLFERERTNTFIGSPYWMAPEVIVCDENPTATYDRRADIWSIGITVIELADGMPPLADMHPMRAMQSIPKKPPPTLEVQPDRWSKNCHDFIAECLVKDFEERKTAEQILLHPWITGLPPDQELRAEAVKVIHVFKRKMLGEEVDVTALLRRRSQKTDKNQFAQQVPGLKLSTDSLPNSTDSPDETRRSVIWSEDDPRRFGGEALTKEWLKVAVANMDLDQLKYALDLAKNTNYKGDEVAVANMDLDQLKYALDLAKNTNYKGDEVNKARMTYEKCAEIQGRAKKALEDLDRQALDRLLVEADGVGLRSQKLDEARHLLHVVPVDKFLQKQLALATAKGDTARVAHVTIQLKDQFYSMFGEQMFQLTNYGFIRTAKDFAKNSQFLKKEENIKTMLVWTKSSIPTSLLKLEPKLTKLAVGIFRRLQGFMGDRQASSPMEQAQEIVDMALLTPGLRDEVYCQIIKQVSLNPHKWSEFKGWQMMQVCVQTFPPSDDFANYLEIFLRKRAIATDNFMAEDFVSALHKTMFEDVTHKPLASVHEILSRPRMAIQKPPAIRDMALQSLPTPPQRKRLDPPGKM